MTWVSAPLVQSVPLSCPCCPEHLGIRAATVGGWQGEGEVKSWKGMQRSHGLPLGQNGLPLWVKMPGVEEEVSGVQGCSRLWKGNC